jgi:hypothetical protein
MSEKIADPFGILYIRLPTRESLHVLYVQGTKDLNTVLRELEEDVNKKIAQEKAK